MAKEIEAKILNLDASKLRSALAAASAVPVSPLTKQKRYVFDIEPGDESRWIRLRTDGKKATLAVKIIHNDEIDGTEEFETEVSSIEQTLDILKQIGYEPKSVQENYREAYKLDKSEITIDYWPKLQPYMEIEAGSEEEVTDVIKKLGLSNEDRTSENTKLLYSKQGIDLDKIKELVFDEGEEKIINTGRQAASA